MAHLIFEFQPQNFVKSHNFCRQIIEKSLVIISESVSDLEKSGGSAPSICIDVVHYKCSKLSIEVLHMPYNKFLVI